MITERNFLEVYPYVKWSNRTIPKFQEGEQLLPSELSLNKAILLNFFALFDLREPQLLLNS